MKRWANGVVGSLLALVLAVWLTPSSAWADQPVPPAVEIVTIPPVTGLRFAFGDQTVVSDAEGIARIPIDRWENLKARIQVLDTPVADGVQARFARFYGELDQPTLKRMRATVNLYYWVSFRFVDLDGQPIEPDLIQSMTIKCNTGEQWVLTSLQPLWLQGSRVVPLQGELLSKDLYFTIEHVFVEGTDVVNESQQKFIPSQGREWQIQLLYYPAHFTARDMLFGFPLGSAINLKFPSGSTRRYPLEGGQAAVAALPRGNYQVSIEGVTGYAPAVPLAMSRDQEVALTAVSAVDMVVGAVVGLSLALGLLLVNRPQLRGRILLIASSRRLARGKGVHGP